MDQASNNVRQSAAFARRLICRTLTVVGGVAAGTALAWWLSSTAASAETEAPADLTGPAAVERVQEVTAPVTGPVERAVTTITQFLQDPPPPPENPLGDLGEKVKDAAQKFRNQAELPDCAVCADTDDTAGTDYPADGYGRSDLPAAQLPAPAPAPLAIPVPADPDTVALGTAVERALADGMSRRGSPEPVAPALPELPDLPAPFSPAVPQGMPTSGGHGSAGNSFDSQHVAVLPWHARVTHLVDGGLFAVADAAGNGRPGNQPGVAPD